MSAMGILWDMPDLFSYSDYRKFLHDYYREQKAVLSYFTVRYIAKKVGFNSASFFSQLTRGRSNMSSELAHRFADFFRFTKSQRLYWETLVAYNQSRSVSEKKEYFDRLATFKQAAVRTVDARQYEFYDKWYYTVIRELLFIRPFDGDCHALGRMLVPAVGSEDVRQAIGKLKAWGMITEGPGGTLVRCDSFSTTTGTEAETVYINNFHQSMLRLAGRALDRMPRHEREVSTVTLSLSADGYAKVLEELARTRRTILQIGESDSCEDRVCSIAMAAFPVTRRLNGKGKP